jgi:ketosteroid isomerase-like protein
VTTRERLYAWTEFRAALEPALAAQLAGNSEPFIALWSQSADAFIFGGLGGFERGIAEIGPRLRWAAERVVATGFRWENLKQEVGEDLALTVDLEHMVRHVDGKAHTRALRVTQVCRFEDGHWRIIHRHADEWRPSGR